MVTVNQLLRNVKKKPKKRFRLLALDGAPQRRGLVYKLTTMAPRKPNSAKRKIAKIRLVCNGKRAFAAIPGKGFDLHEFSAVMLRGGSAKDLPGVNYTLIRGLLDFLMPEFFIRKARRSKFGVKKIDFSAVQKNSDITE